MRINTTVQRSLLLVLGSVIVRFGHLFALPIFAFYLSSTDFRQLDTFLVHTLVLYPVLSLGTDGALGLYLSESNQKIDMVFGNSLLVVILLGLVMIITAFVIDERVALILNAVAFTCQYMCSNYFKWKVEPWRFILINFISSLLPYIIVFTRVKSFEFDGIIRVFIISNIIAFLVGILLVHARKYVFSIDIQLAREILRKAFPLFLLTFLATSQKYLDRLVDSILTISDEDMTTYIYNSRLALIVPTGLLLVISSVQPYLVKSRFTGYSYINERLVNIFFASISLVLVTIIFFDSIYEINKFSLDFSVFGILSLGGIVVAHTSFMSNHFISIRYVWPMLWSSLIGISALFAFILLLETQTIDHLAQAMLISAICSWISLLIIRNYTCGRDTSNEYI